VGCPEEMGIDRWEMVKMLVVICISRAREGISKSASVIALSHITLHALLMIEAKSVPRQRFSPVLTTPLVDIIP
jgi:hypothetical protein